MLGGICAVLPGRATNDAPRVQVISKDGTVNDYAIPEIVTKGIIGEKVVRRQWWHNGHKGSSSRRTRRSAGTAHNLLLSIYTLSTMMSISFKNTRAADLLSGVDTEVIDATGIEAGGKHKAVSSYLAGGGRSREPGSGGTRGDRAARRARRAAGAGSLADARGPDD